LRTNDKKALITGEKRYKKLNCICLNINPKGVYQMKCEIETSMGDIIRLEIESIRFINQSDIMGMMVKDGRKLLIDTKTK
jgi:hypothetical protein